MDKKSASQLNEGVFCTICHNWSSSGNSECSWCNTRFPE